MKHFNRETGRRAEDIATQALEHKDYKILERNFSNRFGEIDIIAQDGQTLVFVEVKAKIGTDFGLPEDMITRGKLQRIRNLAAVYVNGKSFLCRIDVVAIVLTREYTLSRLTHYENVI